MFQAQCLGVWGQALSWGSPGPRLGKDTLLQLHSTAFPMRLTSLGLQRFQAGIIMKIKLLIAQEISSSCRNCGSRSQEMQWCE